ncbi:hypothetical protein DOY81_003160 [Sarcophaga bullata]|nr:hypothetical protein DOY81_003160 [Sarcophaga bullata]
MNLFQIIFVIGCVIVSVVGAPGHNGIKGNNNSNNHQTNINLSLGLFKSIECGYTAKYTHGNSKNIGCRITYNVISGNGNSGNHQSNADVGISLPIPFKG